MRRAWPVRAENLLASLAFGGIMVLPLAQIAARKLFQRAIPGAGPIADNLTLWVGMLGGAIAAREGKLLTLATTEFLPKGRLGTAAHVVAAGVGAMIATLFAMGGIALVRSGLIAGDLMALDIPVWVVDLVLPVAFSLIAVRLAWRSSSSRAGRVLAALGIVAGIVFALNPAWFAGNSAWPWIVVVLIGALFGTPIFALLGGIAMFLFLADGQKIVVLLSQAHDELTSSSQLAAIPLFTLAGFLFAEGKSSERLLRALRALFGWAPGGTAVAAATLCAFFTLLTGGSGVTILALGGLLLPGLLKDGYRERFSMGLLTASGSLGLLFPLSLPLMLYGIIAQNIRLEDLFIAGLLPGLLMLGLVALLGVREGVRSRQPRVPFRAGEAGAAIWEAKWEILLPVVVVGVILMGWAAPAECAPVAALYAVIVQRFIHRDLPAWADIVRVMSDCIALIGGVLLILAVANGLTNYLVSEMIPDKIIAWTTAHVHEQWKFLLALNVFLLLVGCVMDIFSAIVVVVPLIISVAAQFGVDPIHLGIIVIANLELGYLHPPLGLNLLLASIRFKKPVLEVTWATLPMLGILAAGVLLITYWQGLTLGLLHWLGRG